MTRTVEIRHFHLFCGLGGGAKGFNAGKAEVGGLRARFRCIGGIDNDAAAIRDFTRAAGVQGTVLDLFDREQYVAFHGHEPPEGWREATPQDIQRAAGHERPHMVFLSAPCKGFSGLLSETRSLSPKYQALNRLTLRGVFLMLEAFGDDPPEFILFENVPRIASRGVALLDQIQAMLRAYGYAVTPSTHDCGELGGLAQSRKRFLLVARHVEKVPPFIYEPVKRPLRSVGEVIGQLPVPGLGFGGPMHRLPALQWKTWVRLAFVEAGSDWRSLNRLAIKDGVLRDYLIVPAMHNGVLGVTPWSEPSGTVTGNGRPATGRFSVSDPRQIARPHGWGVLQWNRPSGAVGGQTLPSNGRYSVGDPRHVEGAGQYGQYGVKRWSEAAATVTSQRSPGQGPFSVEDPRATGIRHNNVFRVVRFDQPSPAVTGGTGPSAGGLALADPRMSWHPGASSSKMRVTPWDRPGRCVTGAQQVGSGAGAVADPRLGWGAKRKNFNGGKHYGVMRWDEHSGAITAAAGHDSGSFSIADPRLPEAAEQLVCRIISEDGTWHRPYTTLELAALQGLVDLDEELRLDGDSDSAWRERIGNAVPPQAAEAIAGVAGLALLGAWTGQSFMLSSTDIWVRPVAVAIALQPGGIQ